MTPVPLLAQHHIDDSPPLPPIRQLEQGYLSTRPAAYNLRIPSLLPTLSSELGDDDASHIPSLKLKPKRIKEGAESFYLF
jgi:hypothetical protein